METLRILDVNIKSSSSIEISFTHSLTKSLITSNLEIISLSANVPDAEVVKVTVNKNILYVTCRPLTYLATYDIVLKSVAGSIFQSLNGDAIIQEDGVSNKYSIIGPIEDNNIIKTYLLSLYNNGVFNPSDPNTNIAKYIDSISGLLSKALYDIRQVKNENYISYTVTDEQKTRGSGPFDRLNQESAYEIHRVGLSTTNSTVYNNISYEAFPYYPITLQKKTYIESLSVSSNDDIGYFNLNNLTLNVKNYPVTRVTSIIFTFKSFNTYAYDYSSLGYQLKSSRYDQEYASTYLLLNDNQIRLSDKILSDLNYDGNNILKVDVVYEYKDLGVIIDPNSINVFTIKNAVREVLPPIVNIFNLKNAPIVDSNNNVLTSGGLQFYNPNSINYNSHPAFLYEVPFRLNSLPSIPGQYSVDYSTGTVYVYGEDNNATGTGATPPLVSYNYRYTFKSEQDYVYDDSFIEVVCLPNGSLIDNSGKISFKFEKVLVPGKDYECNLHKEELSERIGNNLLTLNSLKTINSPVTNVFRIFNETSGEIYNVTRWNDNKVYFQYTTPPNILSNTKERATFKQSTNELLTVNKTLVNSYSTNIYKILLSNNNIISNSEDCLGSFTNTSVVFTNTFIFINEKYFNSELSESINIDRLSIGEYCIDYSNGVVYCAVANVNDLNLGFINYKYKEISPQNPHILSVDEIYYQIDESSNKYNAFDYISFGENSIIPKTIDFSDEKYIEEYPYLINSGVVGYDPGIFTAGVNRNIKSIRGLYEYDDYNNNIYPLNFSEYCIYNQNYIQVSQYQKTIYTNVKLSGTDLVVELPENIKYISPNIKYVFSVVRTSDSAELWDISGTVITGDVLTLKLSGINVPVDGDYVKVVYSFSINDLSRIVVDYNKGEYYIDYTYLADEIIISYEYGENVLDFRNSNLSSGTTYYATYKVGALRNSLAKNFGSLVNIDELKELDTELERERYRDAIYAALSSFIIGPTKQAISNIGKTISHIEPEIKESIFDGWSLANSLLAKQDINTNGEFKLLPGKFGNGVLIDSKNQEISVPVNSSLRLEEGTFESWIIPNWDGIDINHELEFNFKIPNYPIPSSNLKAVTFIGATGIPANPDDNGTFKIKNIVPGIPDLDRVGIYIYYNFDNTKNQYRWYVTFNVPLSPPSFPPIIAYLSIKSPGLLYDYNDQNAMLYPSGYNSFSGENVININFDLSVVGKFTIDFISDTNKYIFDLGDRSKNRLSLYKDPSGYINLRAIDKFEQQYLISHNISFWQKNEKHHVAASWKLNTLNKKDELHLFVDGLEVPNNIKYGQSAPFLNIKPFESIQDELIIFKSTKDIFASNDMVTIAGSNKVTSSINFSTKNISPGDLLFINESGFSTSGYTIAPFGINGNELTLTTNMPFSLTNVRYSVNQQSITVSSEVDVYKRISLNKIAPICNGSDLNGSIGDSFVTSTLLNFDGYLTYGNKYLLLIDSMPEPFIVNNFTSNTLYVNYPLPASFSGDTYTIYNLNDIVQTNGVKSDLFELNGIRSISPSYSISKDGYYNNILTISNQVDKGDIVFLRTYGLNFSNINSKYYVWGDLKENILMTRMAPPISLDEVSIKRIILDTVSINTSNTSLIGPAYQYINSSLDQPTNQTGGRLLEATVFGTNVDFSNPVILSISGTSNLLPITETLIFNGYGSLYTTNLFSNISNITLDVVPLDPTNEFLSFTIKEKNNITYKESDGYCPIINYSYFMEAGNKLESSGYDLVKDNSKTFSFYENNNYLLITSPPTAAGYYKIINISPDRHELQIVPYNAAASLPLPSFTNAIYEVLNTTTYRSGLQEGLFTFEQIDSPGIPFMLPRGFYEISYKTYLSIKLDPIDGSLYLGTDITKNLPLDGILDQTITYSNMLIDTRVQETIPANQRSITKDYNLVKPIKSNASTLLLLDFDSYPFKDYSSYYKATKDDNKHFLSSAVVNENFSNSIVLLDKPIIKDNFGIIDTTKQGTIEFWMSPLFDTANDPNERYYFDACSVMYEESVSINNSTVILNANAGKILSITMKDNPSVDYFAGGYIDYSYNDCLIETETSVTNTKVVLTKKAKQILSVTRIGSNIDYFDGGSLSSDGLSIYLGKSLPLINDNVQIIYKPYDTLSGLNRQVIRLNKKLPYQNTNVVVKFLPQGFQGDRISLFKDRSGNINFSVIASGINYLVQAPTRWVKDTWHRIKASYKFNDGYMKDEMHLFVDGYEYTNIRFDPSLIFGSLPISIGSASPGGNNPLKSTIKFKDQINTIYIGSSFEESKGAYCLMDNLRFSNIMRPIYAPYGESIDVNYNSNINAAIPITSDLYTTYILDFNEIFEKTTDFVILRNRYSGNFDFSVNIIDSFDIVSSSAKVKQVLEKLLNVLKPANSRVLISYQ